MEQEEGDVMGPTYVDQIDQIGYCVKQQWKVIMKFNDPCPKRGYIYLTALGRIVRASTFWSVELHWGIRENNHETIFL
jgi:hypothetical protein